MSLVMAFLMVPWYDARPSNTPVGWSFFGYLLVFSVLLVLLFGDLLSD